MYVSSSRQEIGILSLLGDVLVDTKNAPKPSTKY